MSGRLEVLNRTEGYGHETIPSDLSIDEAEEPVDPVASTRLGLVDVNTSCVAPTGLRTDGMTLT